MPIRVLIVDDSTFFRQQIIGLLKTDNDFLVVGEASNGKEAVEKNEKLNLRIWCVS